MNRWTKLLDKAPASAGNLTFREFRGLLESLGFVPRRQRGTSHLTYKHPDIDEVLTVQSGRHGKAVPWQVKKLLRWVEQYELIERPPHADR